MEHDEATFGSDGRYTCTDYLYLYELLLDQEHELLTSISKNNASEPGLLPSEWSTSAQNGIESALLAKDVVTYTKFRSSRTPSSKKKFNERIPVLPLSSQYLLWSGAYRKLNPQPSKLVFQVSLQEISADTIVVEFDNVRIGFLATLQCKGVRGAVGLHSQYI